MQDIIIKRIKESNISSTCRPIPFTTITDKCTRLCDVPGTHNVGLPTKYWFNVGPASQPIAGSMPVNRIRRSPNIKTEMGDYPVIHWRVLPPEQVKGHGNCSENFTLCWGTATHRFAFITPLQR